MNLFLWIDEALLRAARMAGAAWVKWTMTSTKILTIAFLVLAVAFILFDALYCFSSRRIYGTMMSIILSFFRLLDLRSAIDERMVFPFLARVLTALMCVFSLDVEVTATLITHQMCVSWFSVHLLALTIGVYLANVKMEPPVAAMLVRRTT